MCASVAVAVFLRNSPGPAGACRRVTEQRDGMTLELLTIDGFADKVGDAFVIEEAEFPSIPLTLAEAKPVRNLAGVQRAPFSLVFTSQGDFVLDQRMYALRHPALGLQHIFLVPIGRDGDIVSYQALFN